MWEPIAGCESAAILRVPFRNPDGSVLREWVSRFDIYPFLERFALDVEKEVRTRSSVDWMKFDWRWVGGCEHAVFHCRVGMRRMHAEAGIRDCCC